MSCTVWDSLELSGTVWDSLGLSGTLLTQLGHTQIELLDGWDLRIRGRLSEIFETLLLLEHLAVLTNEVIVGGLNVNSVLFSSSA